jgi:hypothetical protein
MKRRSNEERVRRKKEEEGEGRKKESAEDRREANEKLRCTVAAPRQHVVPANYKHASLTLRRACSDPFLIELHGTWHRYSPG